MKQRGKIIGPPPIKHASDGTEKLSVCNGVILYFNFSYKYCVTSVLYKIDKINNLFCWVISHNVKKQGVT